jgi:protein-tyrosine phosphatase
MVGSGRSDAHLNHQPPTTNHQPPTRLIDIHHHCLPGVDDGPRELDEAVEMCAMAADEGIETIVATPHVLRGRWRTAPRAELERKLEELRARTNDTPHLVLGSEYFFAHDIADAVASGESVVPLANSRYVLVEFASNNVPPHLEQPFYRLQLGGWTPVIAHPERNVVFQSKPELLASLIQIGARTQVTLGSLTGDFGKTAQEVAESWILGGFVHFVATDAHNVGKRPPRARAALAALRELAGDAVCDALAVHNPRAVTEGRALAWEPEPQLPRSSGFFKRFGRFWRGL